LLSICAVEVIKSESYITAQSGLLKEGGKKSSPQDNAQNDVFFAQNNDYLGLEQLIIYIKVDIKLSWCCGVELLNRWSQIQTKH
jgi:hypothetical protein